MNGERRIMFERHTRGTSVLVALALCPLIFPSSFTSPMSGESLVMSPSTIRASSSSSSSSPYPSLDGAPAPSDGPKRRWQSYYTLEAITRTKSTAQVLHEAAEDERALDAPVASSGDDPLLPTSSSPSDGDAELPPCRPQGLMKVLTVWDVIAYGIGSTLGAGIFAITGSGAAAAGPAVVLSFMVAAIACLFSALSYMEFAARVPIAGSAYTFTYVCLGELAAWFVGWNLTLEYMISAALVARTWSSNLALFMEQIGVDYPTWLDSLYVNGGVISNLSPMSALICIICMAILLLGAKESSNFNIFITTLNVSVICFIIILGSFHIDTANWTIPEPPSTVHTYFPKGINGVLTGAATVFFSYIGFDCVTTLAEEVKNPKRDIPVGIIVTLIVSTLLYIATSLVVTGMQPWFILAALDAPLAGAFNNVGVKWAATLISFATVVALTGNTLTSLFGQPRIFYRMAKDGLLFPTFARLHPVSQVPLAGTIWTGLGAAVIAFLIPVSSLSDMISIGTLMAFSTVCAGVVIIRYERLAYQPHALVDPSQSPNPATPGTPYVNIGSSSPIDDPLLAQLPSDTWSNLKVSPTFWLSVYLIPVVAFCVCVRHLDAVPYYVLFPLAIICVIPVVIISRLPVCTPNWPKAGNFVCPYVPYVPCLGIFINVYLISSLGLYSYVRIIVWTVIGFSIYFLYGIFNSTLQDQLAKYHAVQQSQPMEDGVGGDNNNKDDAGIQQRGGYVSPALRD